MNKFPVIIGIITLLIVIGGVFLFSNKETSTTFNLPTGLEYYWIEGCPHCKNVEDFINTWEKKDQVVINKLESQTNRQNGLRLISVGKYCKIDNQSLGAVPLLFTPEGKCFLGDEPIINYLNSL